MDCPRPIKLVLHRFYPTWSSRIQTRPSMRIQRSEEAIYIQTYYALIAEAGQLCKTVAYWCEIVLGGLPNNVLVWQGNA